MNYEDRSYMVQGWVTVEEDQHVMNAEIDDELDRLDANDDVDSDDDNDNDDDGGMDGDGDVIVSNVCNIISLIEAEDHINQLKLYIGQSGAPAKRCDSLLTLGQHLRSHNASKPRNSPTILQYFKKTINKL